MSSSNDNADIFMPTAEALEFLSSEAGLSVDEEHIRLLMQMHILPSYKQAESGLLYLRDDLLECVPFLRTVREWSGGAHRRGVTLFDPGQPSFADFLDGTRVWLPSANEYVDPAFYVGVRELAKLAKPIAPQEMTDQSYFPPTRITTRNNAVSSYAKRQLARGSVIRSARSGEFANSAYYMGCKRDLVGWLVEAFGTELGKDGVVADLMCGSGVVAGASARQWDTFASDSQGFCRVLAKVQGGGFSRFQGQALLDRLLPVAREHASQLGRTLKSAVESEDALFHEDIDRSLLQRYAQFVSDFPTYPKKGSSEWDPTAEVIQRQAAKIRIRPYVLFTAYFANVFFGVRQCIEIDSLRFAIDTLDDDTGRTWALGALVASVSKIATTYAGHFAQPLVRDWTKLSISSLARIIERRSWSVIHEFTVRLMNLSQESEGVSQAIKIVPGPWQEAINTMAELNRGRNVLVYLDPPYRREEYSRYYHVLETLLTYSYPESVGIGRVPSKGLNGRFVSEFFTRSADKMVHALASVIKSVVDRGWTCAWSYSDNSDANIAAVLEAVKSTASIHARSYVAPYTHRSQGAGRSPKRVSEHIILTRPR